VTSLGGLVGQLYPTGCDELFAKSQPNASCNFDRFKIANPACEPQVAVGCESMCNFLANSCPRFVLSQPHVDFFEENQQFLGNTSQCQVRGYLPRRRDLVLTFSKRRTVTAGGNC